MNKKIVFTTLILGTITAFSSTNATAESQDLALDPADYNLVMMRFSRNSSGTIDPANTFASIQLVDGAAPWNLRVDSGKVFTCDLTLNSVALGSERSDRMFATLIAAKATKRQTLLTITDKFDSGESRSGVCVVTSVGFY